jgi:8-oxo-dGTP pyrophosphatase MutT (NUDIX family)
MKSADQTEAAVAIIIARQPAPAVLVLKRKASPDDPWSGHYAFPGGRRDADDSSPLDTCIRETYEECGVLLSIRDLVKQYPIRQAGNSLSRPIPVTPYLFELPERPSIRLQKMEISCHEWLGLSYASNADNVIERPMNPRRPGVLYPCIPVTEGLVWGFTYEALMLIITDRYPRIS